MKTMGLSQLTLVAPRNFPHPDANKMAAGAEDLLEQVSVVQTVEEAIKACTMVVASSVRSRSYDIPELSPWQAADCLIQHNKTKPVALLFGPERMGLHNKDLELANYRVTIPSNPEYSSLNLAAAVQILCYELYKRDISPEVEQHNEVEHLNLPTTHQFQRLMGEIEEVLRDVSFLRPHQGETMKRIKHLLNRAQLSEVDHNILAGILRAVKKRHES